MKRLLTILLGSSLLVVGGAGCTKRTKLEYGLDVKDTLRWQVVSEPPSVDWHVATDTTSSQITDNLMRGLIKFDFAADGSVIQTPALATEWSASKDQKNWTFKIRRGVLWTDGVEFTAEHVVDGWERLLNPKTGAEYANFLFNVKNAKAYFEGKITDFSQVGVKVNPEGNLEVELELSQSYFPMILAHHSTFPIRKDVVAKFGDKWTRPENIVTLGPFKLKVWEHDKALVLERNDAFFGEKARVKNILGRIVNEQSTALNMFKKGDLDVVMEVPSIEIEKVKTMPEYVKYPILGIYLMGFNVKKAPFDNVNVRKALAHAIDREEINRILGGEKIPASSLYPGGLLGADNAIGAKFDPELARKLLDEAGYKDRSKFPRIEIGFNTSENHQRVMEIIQAQLKKHLGVVAELVNEEWKTYLKSLQTKKRYSMFRYAWIGDYPDPDTFADLFVSDGGNNHTSWGSAQYDELLKKGRSEGNVEKRRQIYIEAQKLLLEEAVPAAVLYHYTNQKLVSKRVQNFPANIMDKFYFDNVALATE